MRPPHRPPGPSRTLRTRDQRGVVFPSPVVILSIVAVAMAAFAFVATRGQEPTEREVTPVASSPSPSETTASPSTPKPKPKPAKPPVDKGSVYVEVYNNSGVTGLAGRVGGTATQAGWKVVGTDNWYGTIPASTVYYPPRLERAAKALALDLGIGRTVLAIDPMKRDRLTVILTSDHG
jgi:LytR cell envelope-related transcriptional attenuator